MHLVVVDLLSSFRWCVCRAHIIVMHIKGDKLANVFFFIVFDVGVGYVLLSYMVAAQRLLVKHSDVRLTLSG